MAKKAKFITTVSSRIPKGIGAAPDGVGSSNTGVRNRPKGSFIIGARGFYPRSAFLMSTKEQSALAQKMGYEGVQLYPTWRVCQEILFSGKLTLEKEMLGSVERDWRYDRVMEAKMKDKPWFWYQLKNKEDWLFPPSGFCLKILRKIQKKYGVPITTRWYKDLDNFSPVRLELWDKDCGINHRGLLKWLSQGKGKNMVALDSAKWTSWLKSNNLLDKEKETMDQILPYIGEVHYRVKGKYRARMDLGGELGGDTHEVLGRVLKRGYRGKIIFEFGWPDIDKPEVDWFFPQWKKIERFHQKLREDVSRFLKPVSPSLSEELIKRLYSTLSIPLDYLVAREAMRKEYQIIIASMKEVC